MAVESAEDRASFFDTDEFGDTVTYYPVDGPKITDLKGQFDRAHLEVAPGGEVTVNGRNALFLCQTSDIPNAQENDRLALADGTVFRVYDVQPDGTGMTLLILADPDWP